MFGKAGLLLLAAAAIVRADFMVYTEPPIPTTAVPSFANPSEVHSPSPPNLHTISNNPQAASWTTSVGLNARFAYGAFTRSLGSSYQSSLTSARSEIDAWAATASNYSIPAEVTQADSTPTYFSKPDWYTALPSKARAFKEQQVSDQFAIVKSVIGGGASTATSTAGAVPTARVDQWVGVEFGVMAAAAVAAFL
jgi:hypothetical protein